MVGLLLLAGYVTANCITFSHNSKSGVGLQEKGGCRVVPPLSFFVMDKKPPQNHAKTIAATGQGLKTATGQNRERRPHQGVLGFSSVYPTRQRHKMA